MNLIDRARIQRAVLTYDFWLDLSGVPRRRRKDLRRELRANLFDASTRSGVGPAIAALGGLRRMAVESGVPGARTPRWTAGAYAAYATFLALIYLQIYASFSWIDGAKAASPNAEVRGGLALFPGAETWYTPGPDGGFGFQTGWSPIVLTVLVFLLVARPWRVISARRHRTSAAATAAAAPRAR